MYELLPSQTDQASLRRYSELLGSVFTGAQKFSEAYLEWQYRENPAGTVVGYDAITKDGKLAAHYVTIPVTYQREGTPARYLLSLNTATHPHHQGKGLFTQLATKTFESASALGFEAVVGIANQNSTPGFIGKLGFHLVTPLDVRIGSGTIRYPSARPDFSSAWTAETAEWRLACPSGRYFSEAGRLMSRTDRRGISAVLSQRPELASGPPPGRSIARMWIGHAPGSRFGTMWIRLPDRLKPSPLNLIYRGLQSDEVPSSSEIRIEAVDFDAY